MRAAKYVLGAVAVAAWLAVMANGHETSVPWSIAAGGLGLVLLVRRG